MASEIAAKQNANGLAAEEPMFSEHLEPEQPGMRKP